MVDKNNVDKHRYSLPGVKGRVVETEKWGRNKAARLYGEPQSPNMRPKDESRPQSPENKQGPKYHNDTASDWRRGYGKGGESAEGKPGYVRGGAATKSYPFSAPKSRGAGTLPDSLRSDPGPWLKSGTARQAGPAVKFNTHKEK
jgi:hypothetical protein